MYQSLKHFELESCWEAGLQYSIIVSSVLSKDGTALI